MRIAIEGCCHGQLDDIYGSIRLIEQRENCKIDLVLICGDFQSIRNYADLDCMAVPQTYKKLGTFWRYYAGKVRAPYPTIFIGGNHEASNYLWELYHGGWVCDNIYYLGHSGVIQFGGLRIGGLSGIAKSNFHNGHHETSPYNPSEIRSAYHVRKYDVQKLLQVSEPLDIFLSHDWPRGVERYGDLQDLLNRKKFFQAEVKSNTLGSPHNEAILRKLKPEYWFAAHLHVHYAALINHDDFSKDIYPKETQTILDNLNKNQGNSDNNPDEIKIDFDDDLDSSPSENLQQVVDDLSKNTASSNAKYTKFLSLDKCLPGRGFLQIIDIPSVNDETGDHDFYYDMEWLAITRAMHDYLSTTTEQPSIPSAEVLKSMIDKERAYLEAKEQSKLLDLKIPHNFEPTAPVHDPETRYSPQEKWDYQHPFLNPQTVQFCKEIDIENKINPNCRENVQSSTPFVSKQRPERFTSGDPNKIPLGPKRIKIESEIKIDDDDLFE